MEPNKQDDATWYNPTADLEARLRAMGLGVPPSPSLLLGQQVLQPTVVRGPMDMPQPPPQVVGPNAMRDMRLRLLETIAASPPTLFNSTADLEAHLLAMGLGGVGSSHLPLLSPQQMLEATAAPMVRAPMHMPRPQSPAQVLGPNATPDMRWLLSRLQTQQQPPSYYAGESSSGAGYVSPGGACIRSSIYDSHIGVRSQRSIAPAELTPSVAPMPSRRSARVEECSPIPLSHFPVPQSPSTHISSASQRQASGSEPRLGVTAASSARNDNAMANPDTAALLRRLRWREWALEQARASLLGGPREGEPGPYGDHRIVEMFKEYRAQVVRLLAGGEEEVRLRVLARVKRVVEKVMECSEGHAVFLALLRACEGRFDELEGIVKSACISKFFLMHVLTLDHGEQTLKAFVQAVAPNPNLRETLIKTFLREGLFMHTNGAALLRHCFTILSPYEDCLSIIIRFATSNFDVLRSFANGRGCLLECLANATNGGLQALENAVLDRTSALAKGKHGSTFLRQVLERGSEQLQVRIAERVAQDMVGLSMHRHGSFLVQSCFLRTAPPAVLECFLAAFLALHDNGLAAMVQGVHSSYVVQSLLVAGCAAKDDIQRLTYALASRIHTLPPAVLNDKSAEFVMRMIQNLF